MPNVPNLDCMPQDELMSFWLQFRRPSRSDAVALIGDKRPGYTTICGALAGYASNKAAAMSCRLRGDIAGADCYERICESIYNELPADCRW